MCNKYLGRIHQNQYMSAGQDVPDHVVQRLSYHSNWLGVKECTGNQRIQSYSDQGIMCWSGNDDEAHDGRHNHGGQVGLFTLHVICTRAIAFKT